MDEFVFLLFVLPLILHFWYLLFKLLTYIAQVETIQAAIAPLASIVNLERVTYAIGAFGLTLPLLAYLLPQWVPEWLGNLAPEFVGMAVTVLIIEKLVEARNKAQRKRELIEQLYSPVRDIAVEALRLVRKEGWWDEVDKSTFNGVQWTGADLYGAALKGANLQKAKLEGANLTTADLERADLLDANLEGASLWLTNLNGLIFKKRILRTQSLILPS